MSDGSAEQAPDHVVFVVHGVGDPQPADALTALVDSYCAHTGAKPTGPRISSALKDEPEGGDEAASNRSAEPAMATSALPDPFIRTFPVNRLDTVRAVDAGRSERTRFVEVYWGDLSRVKGSAAGLVLGTIDLLFGLRHVVKAARLEIEALPLRPAIRRVASWAGEAASASQGLIRGPLLALNVFAAIVVALFLMDAASRLPLSDNEARIIELGVDRVATAFGPCKDFVARLDTDLPPSVLSAAGRLTPEAVYCASGGLGLPISFVVALGLGVVLLLLALARGWSIAMASCLTAAGAAGVLWWAWSLGGGGGLPTYARLIEDLTGVLSLGATLVAFCVLFMLGLSLLAWASAALFCREASKPLRRALTVVNVCTTLSTALFVLLLMVAWATLSRQIDIAVLAKRIEGGLHLFVVVWCTFVLIGLAYGGIVWCGARRKRKYERGDTTVAFPRYIVGSVAVAAVIFSALVWPAVFMPTVVALECGNEGQRVWELLGICGRPGDWFTTVSVSLLRLVHAADGLVSLAIMLSIGAVILLFAARAHFGTALDIVLDVVSHFSLTDPPKRDRTPVRRIIFERIMQSIPFLRRKPKPEHAIWHTIVRRFCSVIEDTLSEQAQGVPGSAAPRVSVLAHSQGTMIALEGLGLITIERRGNFPKGRPPLLLPPRLGPICLVTMGCPLTHLYMHYFPRQYDVVLPPPEPRPVWINIYRADDFVGRKVVSDQPGRFEPHDLPVAPRGHVNYWSDREVLKHLVEGKHKVL